MPSHRNRGLQISLVRLGPSASGPGSLVSEFFCDGAQKIQVRYGVFASGLRARGKDHHNDSFLRIAAALGPWDVNNGWTGESATLDTMPGWVPTGELRPLAPLLPQLFHEFRFASGIRETSPKSLLDQNPGPNPQSHAKFDSTPSMGNSGASPAFLHFSRNSVLLFR